MEATASPATADTTGAPSMADSVRPVRLAVLLVTPPPPATVAYLGTICTKTTVWPAQPTAPAVPTGPPALPAPKAFSSRISVSSARRLPTKAQLAAHPASP